jgi:rhodanese-related sulfurtransferase
MDILKNIVDTVTGIKSISYQNYESQLKGKATLVDVRQPAEFATGHLPEAVNIPLDSIESNCGAIPKDRKVVTICAHGVRSVKAAQALAKKGYDVASISGGNAVVPEKDKVK